MATQAAPKGGSWASSLFGVASGPPALFNTQPDGQPQFRKRAPSMFDTEPDGKQDFRERQLKLFERKPSDPSDPSSSPLEVPIKWDLTREFFLYPNGKGGPVKLPSTQHVKRPSPEMVQKLRQGKPEFFLTGCKITPASEISHEWGYEGSILLYDPKDPADSSVEYVYLTDHLPEQSETRRGVLTDPKSNLFFVTLKGDSLPTYHFWQDARKDGNPGEAEVFDWATYMDTCASRRASEQLDSDTIRISGELHRENDDFEDNEEDKIDEAINAKLRGVKRLTRLRDGLFDDDSINLSRPSRKHKYTSTPKPPPARDSHDDFFLDSDNNELEGEALHRGLKDLFGFGRYYGCQMDRFEYADPEVERLAREFEENLRVKGLESTLRDFGFWQGNRSKKNQHFGGRSPPSEPPKLNWPKNKVLETVAYKLAVASKHTKGLPPLTGDEPWTRDDSIGFWTSLDPKIKPRVPSRLQKQDPTRYKRPAGVTKERNKNENMFTGGFTNFRNRFQRAPREPSYIRPWEQTSWKPKLQVDSEIELHQHLRRLRRRPKKSNLRQTTTRSTLSSSRPTHYPSSGRSSEWRNVTSSDISSRLAPPGAWSFRTRSTRSYPDSSPNHSPMSDVRSTNPDPFLPRTSYSFPTRTDSRETYGPSTLSFADSWWQQNSQMYGPLRQRGSFAHLATASSGTPPSSSRHASAEAWATGLVDEDLPFHDFDGDYTSGLHRGRRAAAKGRVSFDLPEDDGRRGVPFREVRLRGGRLKEMRSALHKTRGDGEQALRDTCQICTEDLTSAPDWLKRHHYRRHGRYLRASSSSSTDYVPWFTVACHVCHKLLATPREYALCYKHHFKGKLGNALENHPEVQRELRRMNWRVTCPTCHRDLRDLTRLEWPKHFASHGPTLASIAEHKARDKADFWKQWFDTASGHGPVAGNVRNTVDQYICSICKNPLFEMTTAQKRQHYNAHVWEGAAVPGKFATIAEAAADVNTTMYESESDVDDPNGDMLVDSINTHRTPQRAVDADKDNGDNFEDSISDSTDWDIVPTGFMEEHYSRERISKRAKERDERFKRQYRPHSAPPTHRFPRSSSTGPSSSQPTRSLFPNAPTTPENDFDSIFDNRRPTKPQRRPKPRSTPRRHRSSSAPPSSSKLAALQSDRGGEAHVDDGNDGDGYYDEGNYGNNGDEEPLLGGKEDPFNETGDPFEDSNGYKNQDDAYHDNSFNSPLYGLHRRPSIRKLISDCFTGSTGDRPRNTTQTRAPDRDAALRAEVRTRLSIDHHRQRTHLPPLAWPPITRAHLSERRASLRQTLDAASPSWRAASRADARLLHHAALVLAHEDARLTGAGAAPSLYDAQRHRWYRRTHARLVAHVRANAARRASGRPPAAFPDFDVALLAERVHERPGAYGFDEGLAHHEARVARRRVVAERAYARAHPEWDGGMRAGMVFDEGVVPGREFGDGDGREGFLDDDEEEEDVGRGVPPPGLERERRERGHVPDEVGPAVDVDSEEEPLPRYPEFDEAADVPAAQTPPPPYRTLFGFPRRNRSGRGGPAQDIARVPVSNRSINRMPDVSRNREQSAATAARARERFYAKEDNGELHRSLASKASRHHPYQRGVAGELHRRVASDPEDEEEEDSPRWLHRRGDEDEEISGDDVQTARSSVVPEGLKRDVASGRPVAEIENEWLEEINESAELSRFWLRLRAALVLDEQLRMESEEERLAKEASIVPAGQSLEEGQSGVLGEVVDESEAQQSRLTSSSKRKIKKRRTARDKTYKPTVEDEADEADILEEDAFVVPQIIAEEIVSPRDKKPVNRKRKPAGKPDGPWQPSKQARVEEVPEEFEEPEEKKKGKRKAKAKGIEKTVTFEVKNQPIAELETTTPEFKGKTAGRKREASTSAALTKKPAAKTRTTKSPALKRLSPKTTGKRRKDRSREPSPELERASEGATKYSLRKR